MSSDATAVVHNGQLPEKKNLTFWKFFITVLVMLLGLALLGLILLGFFGSTSGAEFNALTWDSRSFAYTADPITGLQLTGRSYRAEHGVSSGIAPLIKGGVIAPTADRWDLVTLQRGPRATVGRAQILMDYLDAIGTDAKPYWEQWTTDNPQAALEFWPVVRDLVHLSRYDRLPKIFEVARSETDAGRLKAALKTLVVETAIEEAKAQNSAGNAEAAARAVKLGLFYDPQSPQLLQSAIK